MAAAIRSEVPAIGEVMDLSASEEASLGLAHALFTGQPVAGPVVEAFKSSLYGILAVRVSLVDKTGLSLLHFPIVEGGEVVVGSLRATAKCKEGTAAWTAFQTSRVLSSRQLQVRRMEGSPMLTQISQRPGGFTCLDWTELKHHYPNCNIVTVPIEAPEGVLGALTGAAGPEKPEQDLTVEMQALAKGLAHSLTFCKCKSDLQAAVALLQRVCSPEASPGVEAGSSSEATAESKRLPEQAAACASPVTSSSGSFSDAAEGFSAPEDMRHYHPPRIGPKAEYIAPAEWYCQWIHNNVHGQEQHSLASLTKSDTPIHVLGPAPGSGMTGEGPQAESASGCLGHSCTVAACSIASSAEAAGTHASCTTASLGEHQQGLRDQSKSNPEGVGCGASGTACKSSQTGEVQRSQQRVTAANCCGGAPCGQLADLWNTQTFGGGDIRTLGIDRHTLGAYADILPMDEQGSELEAASVSGSEQISGYDPVGHRNRSSMSSDWANSRTSLGSTRDWQEDGDGDDFSEQPIEDAQPLPGGPDGQPMLRLCCGEPGCSTTVWLRPDQLGLEPVDLRSVNLQHVDLESVELAPVSMADLRGGQVPAPLGTMDCAAGQASARQPGGSRAPQRRSAPSAPSLNEWSALRRETPDETPRAHQGARTGSRSAPPPRQHRTAQPRQRMSFEQRWDLTFHSHRLERRFMEGFSKGLLLADKAHCILLLLLMLCCIARDLTSDSHHGAALWLRASGVLALLAAAQLVLLHSKLAALQCREQLASAERLVMPALTLFFCLFLAPAQSQGWPVSYLSGWATLAYLALARRLRLRAHLLLVMPELCMQATACMAGLIARQDSLQPALSSSQQAQVLAAVLVPTTVVYILEQQARWRFLLSEIKSRL